MTVIVKTQIKSTFVKQSCHRLYKTSNHIFTYDLKMFFKLEPPPPPIIIFGKLETYPGMLYHNECVYIYINKKTRHI